MEAVLCGGPYILVSGTRAGGGWEWRGSTKGREVWRGVGGVIWGVGYTAGESAKVQDGLNGFSSVMRSGLGGLEQTP